MKIKVRIIQTEYAEFVVEGEFLEVQRKTVGKTISELTGERFDLLTAPPRCELTYEFEKEDD